MQGGHWLEMSSLVTAVISLSPKSSLCAGGTHLTVLAQGLATYLTVGLCPKDLERIALHVYEETNKWLLFLFQ